MSQLQGIEARRLSRRTIATGAAWAVPVIAVGAAAPAMAASPPTCVPQFTTAQGSFKCCNGTVKNMKLVIKVTDANNCLDDNSASVCINDIQLGNGQDRGQLVFEGSHCAAVNGTITVYLLGTHSCTVNLLVTYTLNGGSAQVATLQSDNIPSGNTDQACMPHAA